MKKLAYPAGRHPRQELARYRNFLKVQAHRLKILHRNGAGGREICAARAGVLDLVIQHLVETLSQLDGGKTWTPLAVVAIGGYGRAELNPLSDIDIMFLHGGQATRGQSHPCLTLISEGMLNDIGLKIGASTRTPADCVHVANKDMQSKTSLIEARLITGDSALFQKFQTLLKERCVRGHEDEYIAARLADQEERRAKHGNSPVMQEPNVKNGCGGLRDYQNLLWMTHFKFGAGTISELVAKEMLSPAEARDLEAAHDFLLRTRTELHYQVTRPVEVISKNLQPSVANYLGFKDRSPWVRLEKFMREYYTHARNIYLITRVVEQRLALTPVKKPLLPALKNLFGRQPPAVVDGFKVAQGRLAAAANRIFDDSPRRLMRVFLLAQQRGLELHPDLAQLIRQKLALVDRAFLNDEHVCATFLEILDHRGNVGATLRAMHEVGLLGRYVPEFGRLTNLVQHEFYHQYAADEHTLVCLQKLDLIWAGQPQPGPAYTELLQGLEKPFLLNLALLLHDAGKTGEYHDHAIASEQLAQKVARRMKLAAPDAAALCHVIRHHLAMSQISQRRDLSDPAVIQQFAELIQNEQNLKLLTLVTVADTLGTSEKLWNGFKDSLLRTLHHKTLDYLRGTGEATQSEEKARDQLALEMARNLPEQVNEEELYAHFESLPLRYFQIQDASDIRVDLELTHEFMVRAVLSDLPRGQEALHPALSWRHFPDRGYTEIKVCTWDRPRLFSRLAGACSAAGFNILSAQIFTRSDGIALDAFYVIDPAAGSGIQREQREQFESIVNRLLERPDASLHRLIARQNVGRPTYQSLAGERLPTRINIDNAASTDRTVIEITTEDRLGLLYVISLGMAELGLDISLAKICTEKGAAIDTFYVTHRYEGKVTSPALQAKVRSKILGAILSLEEKAGE